MDRSSKSRFPPGGEGRIKRLRGKDRSRTALASQPTNAKATRVEIRFEVGRLEDLLRWTLSWGSQAKVIAPDELKKMVKAEAAKMSKG
jgi:predicted DNA-binding transcriptional regulator YafY